jgi:hypothetical protein
MLELVADACETTTTNFLEESEFFPNFFESRVPFEVAFFIGNEDLRCLLAAPAMGNEFSDKFVGNETDDDTDREGEDTEDEGVGPLRTVERVDVEGSTAHENN